MNRCARLMEALASRGLDAALIHRPENMRYLTGYTGEGALFVSPKQTAIITDFRYVEQAGRQAADLSVAVTTAKHRETDCALELTDACGVKRLAVEQDYLSYRSHEELRRALPFVQLSDLGDLVEQLRLVKDAGEIENICQSAAIACRAFENLLGKIHEGMTEKQVQILLDFEMLQLGSEGNAFDTIAAAGVNGSLPHAVPSDYIIRKGDMLTLDFGARKNGYCSDMTRTVAFGKLSDEKREIYDLVYEAHMSALAAVRPGAVCGDIDQIAREKIDARFPNSFGHSLGHGVGLYIHEQPRVSPGSQTVLQSGHVITIEPGVYIPGLGGCRIEDMAILTSDGFINPMNAPKQLIEL